MVSEAALEAMAAANESESSLLCVLHFLSGVVGMDCVLLNARWVSELLLLAAAYRSVFSDPPPPAAAVIQLLLLVLPFLPHVLGGLLLWLRLGRDGNGDGGFPTKRAVMIWQEIVVRAGLVELDLVCRSCVACSPKEAVGELMTVGVAR